MDPAAGEVGLNGWHRRIWQGPTSGLEHLVAERLLILFWLTSENGDRHSFWRTCRYGIENMLVHFVKAPAMHDQTLSEGGQNLFIHVREVVAPTNRGDFLLAGSLPNKNRHVVPQTTTYE